MELVSKSAAVKARREANGSTWRAGRKEGEKNEKAYANKVFHCPPMHDGYGARIASQFSEFAVAMRIQVARRNSPTWSNRNLQPHTTAPGTPIHI